MLDCYPYLKEIPFPDLSRAKLDVLQINLGYRCNLQCQHCHVNAGPQRTEVMSKETLRDIYRFVAEYDIQRVDLTGGAPEMHPDFPAILKQFKQLGCDICVRTNLTVLNLPDYQHYLSLLSEYQVELMASLPCYHAENVDKQRGKGTYDESIQVLKALNRAGYAQHGTALKLNLIYNPQGAYLPPDQQQLEVDYKQQLWEQYHIRFNQLFTITNLPVKRFGSMLLSTGQFEAYLQLLQDAHQEKNLHSVMCRSLLSLDWQGYLYDCDFNQMLDLPIQQQDRRLHISAYHPLKHTDIPIRVAGHCYGCTAGSGSSCGGALN